MTIPDSSFFPFMTERERLLKVAENIRNIMSDYLSQCGLRALVLGISGGIDSALCAALLLPVCLQHHISLIGRSITIETNSNDEVARSLAV